MLDFGGVGSGGWGNGHMGLIFSAIVVLSNRTSMPERAWVSSSLLAIGILNIVLPSCSISSTCLHHPSMLSFPRILPLDHPRALQQSMITSAPTIVIIIIIVVVHFTFNSLSCAEMVVNIKSLDVICTLGVCESHGQR